MKYALVLFAFLVVSCSQKSEEATEQKKGARVQKEGSAGIFTISEITEARFKDAASTYQSPVQPDTNYIKKKSGQLTIPISQFIEDDDTSFIYRDRVVPDIEEEDITHEYKGYYKTIESHLLRTIFYEAVEWQFISRTGTKTQIWDTPIFSPDGKYFMCYLTYGLESEPLGLQIWKVEESQSDPDKPLELMKILELNQLLFNPLECFWTKERSIVMKAEKMKDQYYPEQPSEVYFLELKFK
ncbi:hypothetical protein [Rufibacter sp. LB8]|uniref:hypothetical protein n=1 Tax=Rufibacter sp. LB8 TaxID=2777781 RepID=UPI00178C6583|nr:hypothetical protein [Rufibacter sp. LB8]